MTSRNFDCLAVLMEVYGERVRQDDRYGELNWQIGGSGMFKPTADRAREETERHAQDGTLTWRHIAKEEFWETFAEPDSDPQAQRAEMVQVAAVFVAMIECIDRKWRLGNHSERRPQAQDESGDGAREAQGAGGAEASPENQAQDVT